MITCILKSNEIIFKFLIDCIFETCSDPIKTLCLAEILEFFLQMAVKKNQVQWDDVNEVLKHYNQLLKGR